MPKFDYLTQVKNKIKIQKIVLILPTWRRYIKGTYDSKKYESVYSQTFKSTEFFKFYNFLINDIKLINYMDKLNYKGILCLHPKFSKQSKDFDNNKIFSILEECD